MKIGILTYPLSLNYGGILQNYAMQQVLKSMGHEIYTIDWYNDTGYSSFANHVFRWIGRCVKRYVLRKEVPASWNPQISEVAILSMTKYLNDFIFKHICTTRRVHASALEEIDHEYLFDAYVVGSDQVWNLNCMPTSFLPFVDREGVRKIFYAASGGKKIWTADTNIIRFCKHLVGSFGAISVREQYLQSISTKYLGVTASLVLDPTLLLDERDYMALADMKRSDEGKFVFAYWLDHNSNKEDIANAVGERLNVKVIDSGMPKIYGMNNSSNEDYPKIPSISSWLSNIESSMFVVTDSFHGVLFSVIFKKQFLVVINKSRGEERFKTILKLLDLESRILRNADDTQIIIEKQVNFEDVENRLNRLKSDSMLFLKTALES